MTLWHTEVFLLNKAQHRALGQLVHGALTHHTLPTVVNAKEEVEDNADNGHEEDNQRPRHRLGRLPVVHNDMDDGHRNQYPCQRDTYYI